jgi:hypothetical protein
MDFVTVRQRERRAQNRSIDPDLERSMYKRSHSITIEIPSSHAVYMSHPREVAAMIEKAAAEAK